MINTWDTEDFPVGGAGVVADGDGAVRVPIEATREVGETARREQRADQESRRELYEGPGMDPDFT